MSTSKAKRTTIDGKRYYSIPEIEKPLPSVTTILSIIPTPGLDEWRKNVGEKKAKSISTRAASRGSVMHRMVEEYFKADASYEASIDLYNDLEDRDKYTSETRDIGKSLFNKLYLYIFKNHSIVPILNEGYLYTTEWGGYAGTVDFVATVDDVLTVIDFKSATRPKKHLRNYYLQGAAYAYAYYKMHGNMPERVEIWIANEQNPEPQRIIMDMIKIKKALTYWKKLVFRFHSENE